MPTNWLDYLKDFLGIGGGNELIDSTKLALEDRIASPFYGYFLISWILINWKLIYVAFFIDQGILFEKTGLLRNQYLDSLALPNIWIHFFIEPFLITILLFWVFPYATRIFFTKNIRNKITLKVIELRETSRSTKAKTELVQEETSLLKEEIEKAHEQKKAETETPEIIWDKEFKKFQSSKLFKEFNQIVDSIYEYQGYVTYDTFTINKDILVYADSNGLINLSSDNRRIELTKKGKHFLKKFSELNANYENPS